MSRKTVMDFIKRTSGTPRQIYIPFYLLDICGDSYDAAVLMNQILFWSDDPHRRKDGWYAAPYEKIKQHLRLSKFRVMNAMKILSALGVETKSMISPRHKYARVVHYRVNEEIFIKIIEDYLNTEDSTLWSEETQLDNGVWSEETQLDKIKDVDAVSSKKKREKEEEKRKEIAPSSDAAPSPSQSLDPQSSSLVDGEKTSTPKTAQGKAKDKDELQPPPGSAQPSPTRSAKQQANDALVLALGDAWGIPASNGDYSLYLKKAQDLLKDMPAEKFKAFCDYRKREAGDFADKLTIATMSGNGWVSKFLAWDVTEGEKRRRFVANAERLAPPPREASDATPEERALARKKFLFMQAHFDYEYNDDDWSTGDYVPAQRRA